MECGVGAFVFYGTAERWETAFKTCTRAARAFGGSVRDFTHWVEAFRGYPVDPLVVRWRLDLDFPKPSELSPSWLSLVLWVAKSNSKVAIALRPPPGQFWL